MTVSLYSALTCSMALFSLTTLTQTLWPFPINQLVGVCVIGELIFIQVKTMRKSECVICVCVVFCLVLSLILSGDKQKNLGDAVYWAVTCLLFMKMADPSVTRRLLAAMNRQRGLILGIVILCDLLIVAGTLVPSCYQGGSWGSDKYYRGFAVSPHTFCCGVLMLLALTLFLMRGRPLKSWYALAILPGAAVILASGARTFMVSLAAICVIFCVYHVKVGYWKLILIPAVLIICGLIIIRSGMMDKFQFLLGNKNISNSLAGQLTSGRSEFWLIDWQAYWRYPLINKLFGQGFDNVYLVNRERYGLYIWAHNDLLDVMLSAGLLGTVTYAYALARVVRTFVGSNVSISVKAALVLYLMFPLLFNGLFLYQHYIYSIVFLQLIVTEGDEDADIRCSSGI